MATSVEHGHMSKRRLLVIVLTSTTTFMVAMGAVTFLCWVFRARQQCNSESTMKIWTNQLSTMHQRRIPNTEFSGSDSCKGSARFEVTKSWPWPSDLHDGSKSMVLAYAVLQGATKNFSSSCLLGEGSFGLIYKARLDDGASVAVKRLTGAGQHSHKEFQGEVDLMSRIRHPNLVALLGYARDGPEPLVVYELMQNRSLHDQLHASIKCVSSTGDSFKHQVSFYISHL